MDLAVDNIYKDYKEIILINTTLPTIVFLTIVVLA